MKSMVPVVLLIAGLAWANNPLTRALAPDIASARSYGPVAIVGLLLAGFVLLRMAARRDFRWIPLDRPMLALTVMLVLGLAVGAFRRNNPVLLFGDAAQIAEFGVYYVLGSRLVRTRAQSQWLIAGIAACTLASTLADIAAFTSGDGKAGILLEGQIVVRDIDNFTAMLLPLFVGAVWLGSTWVRRSSTASLGVLGAGIFLSFTRSLWLGGAVALVSTALLYGPSQLKRAIGSRVIVPSIVALAVASIIVSVALRGSLSSDVSPFDLAYSRIAYTFQQFLHPASELQSRRQDEAGAMLAQFAQTPVVGIGLGGEYIGPNGGVFDELTVGKRHFAHDTFLAVLLRTGIVGFALFVVFVFGTLREGISRSRRPTDDWARLIAITATASFIGGLTISLTADALLRHPFAAYYGVLIGLMGNPWVFQKGSAARVATRDSILPVAVSIASYNTADLLRRCVDSVLRHAHDLVGEIVVVDNASADGSADLIGTTFPHVRIIRNATNVGFGRAHNQALSATTAPYLLVLNSDAALLPGALAAMVNKLDLLPEVAIVGPRLISPDGTRQPSPTLLPSLPVVLVRFSGLKYLVRNRSLREWLARRFGAHLEPGLQAHLTPYAGIEPAAGVAECLSGACLLVRRSALRGQDLFDEAFFMYLEDADLCRRVVQNGFTLWYEPNATVLHLVGQSAPVGYRRSAEPLKSLIYYFAKHHGQLRASFVQIVIAASVAIELPVLWLTWLLGQGEARQQRANALGARWTALSAVVRAHPVLTRHGKPAK